METPERRLAYAVRSSRQRHRRRRGEHAAECGEGQRHAAAETPGRDRDEILRDAILRLETRAAENAELRSRLELTEQAESTTREALERETEALQRERERADRLEQENRDLQEEARRPWYKKLFGS